jgi:hypothetical protein
MVEEPLTLPVTRIQSIHSIYRAVDLRERLVEGTG